MTYMPLTWWSSKWKLFFFSFTLKLWISLLARWCSKLRASVTLVKCGRCPPQMCLHGFSTVSHRETNRSNVFIKMPQKKKKKKILSAVPGVKLHCCSCCITPRGYEFKQCFSIWHPAHHKISQAERAGFYTLETYLLFQLFMLHLFSLAVFLFYAFCDEKYITRQAAQEILFRLVIEQKTQREGKESEREREVFFWLRSSLRGAVSPD